MDHFHCWLHSIKVPWPLKVTIVTLHSLLFLIYLNILNINLGVFFRNFLKNLKHLYMTLKQIDHLLFHRGHICILPTGGVLSILNCKKWMADLQRKYILWEIRQSHATLGTNIENEEEDNNRVQVSNFNVINLHWTSLGSGLAAVFALLILIML